jgi:glycosyltransferase involved in cell wall biosynthesis
MKIMHVIPALTKGGAERVVVELANNADAQGHSVTILTATASPDEHLPAPLSRGVAVRHMLRKDQPRRFAYALLVPWMLRNARSIFEQDIVHCHLTFGAVFGSLTQQMRSFLWRRGPAVVETYHAVGMAIPDHVRGFHASLLSGRDAAAIMAEDPYWRRYIAARPDKLVRIIPNGIAPPPAPDPKARERYRAAVGLPRGVLTVGTISRLMYERRPDLLLAVFDTLRASVPVDLHLLLAGEGPERDNLEREVRRLGLQSRVHMPGLVIDPPAAFGVIDLYLTVNVGATTGIAALEAAFAGVPIVAIQLVSSYSPCESDWIWASSDPAQVAARAAALLRDPSALRSVGERQRKVARACYSDSAMADAYYRLYEAALAERRQVCE